MRIGWDWDHTPEWKLLSRYFGLKHLFGHVEIELSPRGNGLHLIVSGLPMDHKAEYVLRSMFGDDPNRIKFDWESEYKPRNILFQTKWTMGGRRYDAEPLDERNILALPWKINPPREVFRHG